MRKGIILLCAAMLPSMMTMGVSAQSAIDGYSLSRYQLRGTARFMSMAGAFGALGGDMSSLTINPAGLGVYRSSEIGATLDIDIQSATTNTYGAKSTVNQTRVACNNFGYVGSAYTGSDLFPYFNWGATYNRVASFDRRFRGNISQLDGSLSNYVAGYTTEGKWPETLLVDNPDYDNPYTSSYMTPWMSILAYNTYMINPVGTSADDPQYAGLWQQGSGGTGSFDVHEKGHVDEYNIDFGGNFTDMVYVGIGFGITDIEYKQNTYYEEDITTNALVSNPSATGVENGSGGFGLENWKRITGTGFNFKAGVIVKPINELRIGFAVHTPTYYNLTSQSVAAVDFGYSSGVAHYGEQYYETNDGYQSNVDWKLRTPWRLMASIAGVIGGQGIISLDYEYRPTQDIKMLTNDGTHLDDFNNDCKNYFESTNIVRLGAEYRLTRNWSLRAGYSYETTNVQDGASNGREMIYTSGLYDMGTQPSYTFDNATQYVTCGLGYRYSNFYVDAAYVYRHQSSHWHAYTPNDYTATPPSSSLSHNSSQIVLSLGFRY